MHIYRRHKLYIASLSTAIDAYTFYLYAPPKQDTNWQVAGKLENKFWKNGVEITFRTTHNLKV